MQMSPLHLDTVTLVLQGALAAFPRLPGAWSSVVTVRLKGTPRFPARAGIGEAKPFFQRCGSKEMPLLTPGGLDYMTIQGLLQPKLFYDKDLKNLPLYCQEKQSFIFFSRKINHADIILSLFIDVSNNIPKRIRQACMGSHGTLLLIIIQVKEA